MTNKSPDAFRTISEVADWLGVPTHVLRFWESRFSQVKPVKRAGGRRYYRPADMELLGGIRHLLHEDGFTIRGVQKMLRESGVKHVSAMSQGLNDMALASAAETNIVNLEPASKPEATDAIDADDIPDPELAAQPAALPVSETDAKDTENQPQEEISAKSETTAPIQTIAETKPDDMPEDVPEDVDATPETTPVAATITADAPDTPNAPPPPQMADISHIPADPDEDSIELPDLKGSLLANLRAARESPPAPLQNHAGLDAIAQRLTTLKIRMKHERMQTKAL